MCALKTWHYQTSCKLNDECHPETPPVTKKQNQHAQTLNEILAKYNKKSMWTLFNEIISNPNNVQQEIH